MNIVSSKSITYIAVFTIASVGALVSFADVATAQVTGKPITIIEHDPKTAQEVVLNPQILDQAINECRYLGAPPQKGPDKVVEKYCELLAKCFKRILTKADSPIGDTAPLTPNQPPKGKELHPLDIKQAKEAMELACLKRFLK